MDFRKIISQTDRYNFHSHTQYCDGRADVDTMARAAVACGMEHYGFTPHSPIPFASPCNMDADDVEAFLADVERVRSQYAGSCRFYAGMEVDYIDASCGPASSYFRESLLTSTGTSIRSDAR